MTHFDATSIPRKMQCVASSSMPVYTPTTGMEQSDDAREGIAAHWLATGMLTGRIDSLDEWADRKAPNGVYINEDIIDSVSYYVEQLRTRPSERRHVELDLLAGGPAFGGVTIGCRPDFIADDLRDYGRRVYIDELKYGWRTVEAENNWVFVAYACAYIQDKVIDHDTMFHFTIHQPRPYHPLGRSRVWIVSAASLMVLRQQLFTQLATVGGPLVTGPYCYKCPARSNCPAIREASMSLLDVTERPIPDDLTVTDMAYLMDALTVADHTLKQYKDALAERITDALIRGQAVPNYRMKHGEGKREWLEGVDASVLRMLAPGKKVTKPETPITPKQAEKFLPETVVNALTKRKSTLTLSRFDAQQLAQSMFGDHNKE